MTKPKSRHYVVTGEPRSGKNSQRIVKRPNGQRFTIKSKAAAEWLAEARSQLAEQRGVMKPIASAVRVDVIVYQKRDACDGDNVQSLAWDALVHARILDDDKYITEWSGEKHVDRACPRVEITVTPIPEAA